MNATTVKFKIDTGADITVMSKQTFQVEEELQRMLKSEHFKSSAADDNQRQRGLPAIWRAADIKQQTDTTHGEFFLIRYPSTVVVVFAIKQLVKSVMDDIMVFSRDIEEHVQNLMAVFRTIRESGLKLNKDKCHFAKSEIQYFQLVIGKDGIQQIK
ncbi:uncharacterized protein K02A2.6-like [Tachysurus ichikawai]